MSTPRAFFPRAAMHAAATAAALVLGACADKELIRPDLLACNQRSLKNPVRIVSDDEPIFERRRLPLRRVDDHRCRFGRGVVVRNREPLFGCRKPGSTPPTKTAVGDCFKHRHLTEGPRGLKRPRLAGIVG